MFAYSNNGLSFRAVSASYIAESGEVLFTDYATPVQLSSAFPGYAAAAATVARQPMVAQAQKALSASDITVVRCYSAGVAVPLAWQEYRIALRDIANGSDTTSTSLPATPAFPTGT